MADAVRGSALWAALGDALGFVTELVDLKGVKRRAKTERVTEPVPWSRRVGGRFGVAVELPEGCYSDDTQLRLATARAIRGDGTFDVEVFAKIELPVWRAYALGAGRGTKAAARSLAKVSTSWTNNFFADKRVDYLRCGGNGAAMRIQPHVWCASDPREPRTYLTDVIRNAICTHGHSRGIVGAAFHAMNVAFALAERRVPDPSNWKAFLTDLKLVPQLVDDHPEMAEYWLPEWERRSREEFSTACGTTVRECYDDIRGIAGLLRGCTSSNYCEIVKRIGGMAPKSRGSGTKTAILASAVAWMFADSPHHGLEVAVNTLGSDTDTIATMAGAILGAVHGETPHSPVLDSDYVAGEATRLAEVAVGRPSESFGYPDLLHWSAPAAEIDVVGRVGRGLGLAGLGAARRMGERRLEQRGNVWEWLQLPFGQTVLVKRRDKPQKLSSHQIPSEEGRLMEPKRTVVAQGSLFDAAEPRLESHAPPSALDIDAATQAAIRSGFDPVVVGDLFLRLSRGPSGLDRAIAFAAIVAKALRARERRHG